MTCALALLVGIAAAPAAAQHMPPANPNYTPAPPKEGYSYPDCYCTDSQGKRVEVGQHACLHIGGREIWALCDWSVNVTTWRHREGESCPTS